MQVVRCRKATPHQPRLVGSVSDFFQQRRHTRRYGSWFFDTTRAHPHCEMKRQVWIQLPSADPRSVELGVCGILKRCLYGTRDAGKELELLFCSVMVDELGFVVGRWSPCMHRHESKDMQAYSYGDSFVAKASREDGQDFQEQLKLHMWAKLEGVLVPNRR